MIIIYQIIYLPIYFLRPGLSVNSIISKQHLLNNLGTFISTVKQMPVVI